MCMWQLPLGPAPQCSPPRRRAEGCQLMQFSSETAFPKFLVTVYVPTSAWSPTHPAQGKLLTQCTHGAPVPCRQAPVHMGKDVLERPTTIGAPPDQSEYGGEKWKSPRIWYTNFWVPDPRPPSSVLIHPCIWDTSMRSRPYKVIGMFGQSTSESMRGRHGFAGRRPSPQFSCHAHGLWFIIRGCGQLDAGQGNPVSGEHSCSASSLGPCSCGIGLDEEGAH